MFVRRAHQIKKEKSISELFKIKIGLVEQWLYIRGENRDKPVILKVHGGPGSARIGFARKSQKELEKHFVIVNWDQRGAGLSYSKKIPTETMTINQIVNDTIEVTNYLRERFQQDKIYLLGHSWGTIIGLLAVQKEPQLFHRYFGVAQYGNYIESEQLSYKFLLEKTKAKNNKKAFEKLSNIGLPPWGNLKHDRVHQKYMEVFSGGISRDGKLVKKYVKDILTSGEYTWLDIINLLKGQFFSMKHLQYEMKKINFNTDIQNIEVPIYFCMGRHDLMIHYEPSYEFYKKLEAPEKYWIWFEDSAHSPMVEEKEKFLSLLIEETNKDLQ